MKASSDASSSTETSTDSSKISSQPAIFEDTGQGVNPDELKDYADDPVSAMAATNAAVAAPAKPKSKGPSVASEDDPPQHRPGHAKPDMALTDDPLGKIQRDEGITRDWSGAYSNKPYFRSQIESGDQKCGKVFIQIFDLSIPDQLKAYEALKNEFADEKSGKTMMSEDIKWVEKTGSWKVLVSWCRLLFKLPVGIIEPE